MKVTAYKTKKIIPGDNLFKILDEYLPDKIQDKTVIAVSSKIVGICEGRVVKNDSEEQRDELAKKEAELYLPREFNQYGFMITINRGIMVASAGIDRSNAGDYYALWPKNPQQSANKIREYLVEKYKVVNVGVVITDSKLSPLRWGVTGVAIAHSGFLALKNYIGTPDVFGKLMQAEKSSIMDSLATAAVIEMGEGNEQTPLAIIEDVRFVDFQKGNPTKKELEDLKIGIGDDVYSSMLTAVKWTKGGAK
ncbi:MAG: coenzyme F420-0:L-glutamate ligase [Patescibacteria group bacterium]